MRVEGRGFSQSCRRDVLPGTLQGPVKQDGHARPPSSVSASDSWSRMQLGPMSLFLRPLDAACGWTVGLAIGLGIALMDALYALCGAAGAASLLTIDALRSSLGAARRGDAARRSACVRCHSALRVRLARRRRRGRSPRRAFMISLAATAANPATLVSWAAVFAATGAAGGAGTPCRSSWPASASAASAG